MKNWFKETLYESYGQQFEVEKILFEVRTGFQHLVIFENKMFGRILALDGVIQTTEKDEFIYHEMMTHVPIFSHGNVKKVLIIGGGDGGILREVTKHKSIEAITMVEIDGGVVEMSKQYLPTLSAGAFDDPRANLIIDDGIAFVKNCQDKFDVIISDSTDPMGPGEVLFTSEFYANCKRCLDHGGILVTQNGVAFMQTEELQTTYVRYKPYFADRGFYAAAIPTYIGGYMAFSWGTDDLEARKRPLPLLQERFKAEGFKTRFYNPELHSGLFNLPQFMLDALIGK